MYGLSRQVVDVVIRLPYLVFVVTKPCGMIWSVWLIDFSREVWNIGCDEEIAFVGHVMDDQALTGEDQTIVYTQWIGKVTWRSLLGLLFWYLINICP